MRTLVLMRAAPGAGKSTFIRNHHLEPYTLSADDIRILCGGLIPQPNGVFSISQSLNKQAWKLLYEMLEERMKLGAFTVIDATHSTKKELENYRKLVDKYRYRVYVIDMTDVPVETAKKRNRLRELYKQVPDEVIDKFYVRFKSEKVPKYYTVIKPEKFEETIIWKAIDVSQYKKVHMIGDIHGNYTVLMEYLNGKINPDELYVFCGDYTDRGIENAEVLQFLQRIYKYPNVALIEGNHEKWVNKWLNDEDTQSNTFNNKTKPELNKALGKGLLNKKKLRDMYRRMYQCFYFSYEDKTVLCTHGGLTNDYRLELINTDLMINGVGKYEEYKQVAETFERGEESTYQVNGHRNVENLPIRVGLRNFNLEGGVEWGGCLRVVTLDKNGFETHEIKNNVWDKPPKLTDDNLVEVLRTNRYVKEKKFGNISSFNFTEQAFREGVWDEQTIKARGLFVNTETNKVVTRGYDKYFRSDEITKTIEELADKLVYPVSAYVKYNGFLGMLSYDYDKNDLRFCTKGVMFQGNNSKAETYVTMFKRIFDSTLDIVGWEKVKRYLKENDVTMLFEVIDPINDPHIIEYNNEAVVLLDIVENKLEFSKLDYNALKHLGDKLGLLVKQQTDVINNKEEFIRWCGIVLDHPIEGYVLEDSSKFMTKIKSLYYTKWKWARTVSECVLKFGSYSKYQTLTDELKEFHDWLIEYSNDNNLDNNDKQIINLRKEFLKDKEG